MIDSLLRRLVPTASTSGSESTAATPEAPTPPSTDHLRDSQRLEAPLASGPLNLTGTASQAALDLPGPLKTLFGGGAKELEGPEFLHIDAGWTPQGQGYDAGREELLTAYYQDHQVLLSFQDKDSGEENLQVILGGKPGDPAGAPSHGGGVSTDGDFVYVADTENVYAYRRDEIEAAAREGRPAEPFQVLDVPTDPVTDPATGLELTSAASYMTIKDGYAYVGSYSKNNDDMAGSVYRYKIDEETGEIDQGTREGPIRAPDRAQGIAVVDGALMFTTGDKKLIYQPYDETTFEADIGDRTDLSNGLIDSYPQGINIIDGELWVTYESGAQQYQTPWNPFDSERKHIQRIPLENLDLDAAGLTPEQLEDLNRVA